MAVLRCVGIGESPVPQLLLPAFAPSRRWHRVARHARRDSNSSYKLSGLRTRTIRVRTSLRVVGRRSEMKNLASRSAKSRCAKVLTFAGDLAADDNRGHKTGAEWAHQPYESTCRQLQTRSFLTRQLCGMGHIPAARRSFLLTRCGSQSASMRARMPECRRDTSQSP